MASVQVLEKNQRKIRWRSHKDPVNVLVLGNNPIELGQVHDTFVEMKDATYQVEYAFDVKEGVKRAVRHHPHFILIDSTFSLGTIVDLVAKLSSDKRTQSIPRVLLIEDRAFDNLEGKINLMISKADFVPDQAAPVFREIVEKHNP